MPICQLSTARIIAMSNPSAAPDAPTRDEELPEPLYFTLQIISPSMGVSGPLSFPLLPATTSVKDLKAKIRDALPSKPVDESQRLIHRGRMLARETETMLEIFGQETLANPESQTLHLVLRPTATDVPITRLPAMIPLAGAGPPIPNLMNPMNPTVQQFPRSQSTPAANPIHGMHAQQPLPGFQHVQQHQVLHQVEHIQNVMAQRLQQLQRETQRLHQEMGLFEQRTRTQPVPGPLLPGQQSAVPPIPLAPPQGLFQMPQRPPQPPAMFQELVNQHQRNRAAEGRQGVQDTAGNPFPFGTVAQTASGRASPNILRPDHTNTYTQAGVGPNGERWQVTVNETTTTVPIPLSQPHQHHQHHQHAAPNPALDIQAVLRNADRLVTSQGGQGNMQRSASVPPAASAPFAPGVTRPGTPGSVNTPATSSSSPSAVMSNLPALSSLNASAQVATPTPAQDTATGPMVYILSSPYGPRALLMSNTETFFTPRQHSRRRQSPAAVLGQGGGLPEYRNRPPHRLRRNNQRQDGAALEPINAPHANPGGGALAARIGPLIWLIVRLVGFVWFFTAGNPSWSRWLMVSGLAFVVFIINTGVFNGAAEQVWGPIRRHLEGLIPLAPAPPAQVVRENEPGNVEVVPDQLAAAGNEAPQRRRRPGELDPAETAARLLEQHRLAQQNNAPWILTQARRLEHSLLLFLASLVPGVGERHIRAREAETAAVEAERQRQIEAEEAAAGAENAEKEGEAGPSTENAGEPSDEAQPEQESVPAPAQPLIEV